MSFPYEGKGDHVVVDEVKMRTVPLSRSVLNRNIPTAYFIFVIRSFDAKIKKINYCNFCTNGEKYAILIVVD